MFFIACLVASFHEISNHFFNFLWDASELILKCANIARYHAACENKLYGLLKRKNWAGSVGLSGTIFVPVEKAVQLTRSGELSTV